MTIAEMIVVTALGMAMEAIMEKVTGMVGVTVTDATTDSYDRLRA